MEIRAYQIETPIRDQETSLSNVKNLKIIKPLIFHNNHMKVLTFEVAGMDYINSCTSQRVTHSPYLFKHLFCACTFLSAEYTTLNKMDKSPTFHGTCILVSEKR